jgi:hypothetical protein
MAQATVPEPETILVPVTPEQEDAEVLAGFNGDEVPTPPAPVASPDAAQDADKPAPVQPEVAAPVSLEDQMKDLLARVTKIDTIEATFNKRFDESFGRIGRLQQIIKDQQAHTPVGQAVEFTEEDFKDLKQEFPELTPALIRGLNPALKRLGLTGGSLNEDRALEIAKAEALQSRLIQAKELLEDQVEGWEAIVGPAGSTTPFRQWLAQQPQDYQTKVSTTFRPGVMAKAIQQFQQTVQPAAQPSVPPEIPKPKEKPAGSTERQARLAAAVTPQGKPAASTSGNKSAEDEMREGFDRA